MHLRRSCSDSHWSISFHRAKGRTCVTVQVLTVNATSKDYGWQDRNEENVIETCIHAKSCDPSMCLRAYSTPASLFLLMVSMVFQELRATYVNQSPTIKAEEPFLIASL